MKYVRIIPVALAATLLTGCGQVMESTANLIDTAAEKIENSNDDNAQAPVVEVVEEPQVAEGVVTETVEEPVQTVAPVVQQKAPEPAAPVQKKQEAVTEKHDTVMDMVMITAEEGNIRAEPSIDAAIVASSNDFEIGQFKYLKERVKTSDGRTWYKVDYGNGIGYISSAVSELIMLGDPPQMPGLEAVKITEAQGNVRAEPYLNSAVIYTGKKGERLEATSATFDMPDGRTWYEVKVNGKYGYISNRVIEEIISDEYAEYNASEFYVTNAEGNVRADASLNSKIVYTAKKGESLTYMQTYENTSDGRTWYEVYVDGHYGYISGAVGELR
ncbi:MAG: SH3 domain-containing protein [Caryophanon sp.]|nr:SH3 domain-containing protein [Caryophanon sp.]